MHIIPAIDLHAGQCVRLSQGRFDAVTVYESSPLLQARRFVDAGASWIHVVDLDGARDGSACQHALIATLARTFPFRLQVGGGIREAADVEKLLQAGVSRVVAGSLAVEDPPHVSSWMRRFGAETVVLAFDVRFDDTGTPIVLTRGWKSSSQKSLWDILEFYRDTNLKRILCTDVSRDGMMHGTNVDLYRAIQDRWPELGVIASGGVSTLDDLRTLHAMGLEGVVVGKALYENAFSLEAALAIGACTAHKPVGNIAGGRL